MPHPCGDFLFGTAQGFACQVPWTCLVQCFFKVMLFRPAPNRATGRSVMTKWPLSCVWGIWKTQCGQGRSLPMARKIDSQSRSPRPTIIIAAVLFTVSAVIALAELMSSQLLIYRYRHDGTLHDGNISSLVLFRKATFKLGWAVALELDLAQVETESIPSPFLKHDPILGFPQFLASSRTFTSADGIRMIHGRHSRLR